MGQHGIIWEYIYINNICITIGCISLGSHFFKKCHHPTRLEAGACPKKSWDIGRKRPTKDAVEADGSRNQ